MKNFLLLILLLPVYLFSQNTESNYFSEHYTKKEVLIPMRDGVKLFTSIYIPKDSSEKHPILITRTPYSCNPYGEDKFSSRYYRNHYINYLKENYIIVVQDVRGCYMSEGKFVDVRPYISNKKNNEIDEASDTYDAIDWLVKNIKNNNGNVGVFGISYPGFYSAMAALSRHPALKAVSPQAPVTDWFIGDDFHHNGAFMLMDAFDFYSSFGKPRPYPTTQSAEGYDFPTKDKYGFFLRTGALQNFTKLLGDSIAFWNDLIKHPNYDAWWKARNDRNFVKDILPTTATLEVGGLFDAEDAFGAQYLYRAIEQNSKNNNKIVLGPWYHGQWASTDGTHLGNVYFESNTTDWYADNIEHPFFNYYLKGKGSADNIKEATVFFTGENKWRTFNVWPPVKNISSTPVYLQANQTLSFQKNLTSKISYEEYISDPAKPVPYNDGVHESRTKEYMDDDQRFAAQRPDVLLFETDTLKNDITIAGPVIADLTVSLSTTDADFVVKLIDVFPDNFEYTNHDDYLMNGYQMLVRGDVMRGRYRNSFEKPEAFVPGKPTEVKYSLVDVAHTFKKGHRIMVQVQSSWFPLVDRNPQQFIDIYHAKDSDFKKASIKVYNNQSKIILPVLK